MHMLAGVLYICRQGNRGENPMGIITYPTIKSLLTNTKDVDGSAQLWRHVSGFYTIGKRPLKGEWDFGGTLENMRSMFSSWTG